MDFFGIGPWEVFLILIVALLVIGPGKIPEIARTLGKTVRAIRKASSELTTAVTRELDVAEKDEKETAPPRIGSNTASAAGREIRPAEPEEKHAPKADTIRPGGAPKTK